ncbi:MAG: DUF4282 domain-containing protein [Mobiluncus sp.]|uniref:DUF4282 domain-containing protein n=1 Tax=Mobiluncus sp. TaxID=47293 RepID=UPI002583DA53|nr:DUF4282 domain-containing protein [Mobiluncus sp.]MCI6585037.1 DUF4282 domain-containing protein [Mobiluncus sp.]
MSFPPPPEDNAPNPSANGPADFPPAPAQPPVNNSYPGTSPQSPFAAPTNSGSTNPYGVPQPTTPYGPPQSGQISPGQPQPAQPAQPSQPSQPWAQPPAGQPYYGSQPAYAPYYPNQSKPKPSFPFKELFDLKFENFISIKVAGVVYAIGIILDVLFAFGLWVTFISSAMALNEYGGAEGLVALAVLSIIPIVLVLFLSILVWRVTLESIVALIRIAENSTTLVKNTAKLGEKDEKSAKG